LGSPNRSFALKKGLARQKRALVYIEMEKGSPHFPYLARRTWSLMKEKTAEGCVYRLFEIAIKPHLKP